MPTGASSWVAIAQTKVFGSGVTRYLHDAHEGEILFRHIAIDAWLDEEGDAHGTMIWEGDIAKVPPASGPPEYTAGPSLPYILDVMDIVFDGNNTFVIGIVVNSPVHTDEGSVAAFSFTDRSGTGDRDLIDGEPTDAGNYTVR